jgi:putative flippase GtrA
VLINAQAIRYAVVGFASFAVDYFVTWLLVPHMPLLLANSIGFLVANLANFLMAHRWVFGYSWASDKVVPAYLTTLTISAIGLVLNNGVVWLTVGVIALPLLWGKVIAAGVVMFWNYVARIVWVYKK